MAFRGWIGLLFVVACLAYKEGEYIIQIEHRGDILKSLDKLSSLGLSLEHPKVDENVVTAYASHVELEALDLNGFKYSILPNPAKEYHQEILARRTKRSAYTLPPPFTYHHYEDLDNFLNAIHEEYPEITQRFSPGKSADGRELYGIRITKNPELNEKKPQFKYVGNMHGDETVGREMLIHFIYQLCSNYSGTTDEAKLITQIVDQTDIYIIPSMNPDGFERGTRSNKNYKDLNRNFPDIRFPGRETANPEPETIAIMNFTKTHHFVLSANLHGGALVANYPYDGNLRRRSGVIEETPDHKVFVHLALTYSENHKTMKDSREFRNGIVNGAEWYVLYGGMQDWNYEQVGCMEITLELSNTKYPRENTLPGFWDENQKSLLQFLLQIHTGVKGVVTDNHGTPLPATIQIQGNAHKVYTNPKNGDYYRLLREGQYYITASSPGYKTKTTSVVIPSDQQPFDVPVVNIQLDKE